MGRIDLDAYRAAREEQPDAEPHELVLGGKTFTLPKRLPMEFVFALTADDFERALQVLLGDQVEEFYAEGPFADELKIIVSEIAVAYGLGTAGEASASGSLSRSNGKRSRRTSNGSTG